VLDTVRAKTAYYISRTKLTPAHLRAFRQVMINKKCNI